MNYERAFGPVFSARVGLGTLSPLGVDVGVPLTARLTVGNDVLTLEAGAGVLVAVVSAEYLFTITTDVEIERSLRVFPATEMALRVSSSRALFVRLGGAVLLEEGRPSGLLVPSLGVGVGL